MALMAERNRGVRTRPDRCRNAVWFIEASFAPRIGSGASKPQCLFLGRGDYVEGIVTFAQYRDFLGQFQSDSLTRKLLILLI